MAAHLVQLKLEYTEELVVLDLSLSDYDSNHSTLCLCRYSVS